MPAVFFDLDGTLIDSRADLALAVNLTRHDYGLPLLPEAQVASYVGEGLRLLVARALPEQPESLDDAVARTRVHYAAHLLDQTTLYPGVKEGLQQLGAQGWQRAVVTNKPREFVQPILAGLGVAKLFEALVGGGDAPNLKPDPALILLAATRLGLSDLGDSWMAGDHFTDLEAGRRAGVRRCFCRYGFGSPREAVFDLAVDSLIELADHLGAARRDTGV